MFRKMLTFCVIIVPFLNGVDPIADGVFYRPEYQLPEYSLIDCACFTTATLDEQHNIQINLVPGNSCHFPELYAHYLAHDNHHSLRSSAQRMTKNIDARQAQVYAYILAQQYRNAVCSQSHLPPDFTDSFERRGIAEKTSAKFFKESYSKHAYEQAFKQKLIALCGINYSPQAAACYQRAEMRQWTQYRYQGYRDFIRSLPVYEDYTLEIAQQFKNDPDFAHQVRTTEQQACTTIKSEAARIIKKRADEAAKRKQRVLEHYKCQRQEIARDIFHEQMPFIEHCMSAWNERKPQRARAYDQTMHEHGRAELHYHDMPQQTQTSLRNHGFNPEEYTSLHGNALQQEILSEVIEGMTAIATIPNPHHRLFDSMIHGATFKVFDGARRVNEMGDCCGAAHLIDLATTLVDYSVAVVEGLAEGVIEGVHDGITGTYHMLRHPIKTAQALGKVAVCIAKMAHEYIPLQGPLWLCTTEQERAEYYQRHARIIQNWAEVDQKLERWWRETPTREKIRVMTKGISSAITNAVVGHQCLQFAGQVCKLAAVEAVALYRKAEQVEVAAAGVPGDMPKMVFNSMSEAERVAEAPATVLLNKVQASAQLMDSCKKLEFSEEIIQKIMQRCESSEQNMRSLITRLKAESEIIQDMSQRVKKLECHIEKTKPLSHYKQNLGVKKHLEIDRLAQEGYEQIRNMSYDIEMIANNTGMKTEFIETAKKHLFLKEHNLGSGRIGKFDPCHDILDSWNRLLENSFNVSDLELLQHEYYESLLMEIIDVDYYVAHAATMKIFPWYP